MFRRKIAEVKGLSEEKPRRRHRKKNDPENEGILAKRKGTSESEGSCEIVAHRWLKRKGRKE